MKTDIHPRLSQSMGKHLRLLLNACIEAHAQAGLEPVEREEIGFFAGMGMIDPHLEDLLPAVMKSRSAEGKIDYEKFFSAGYREIYPLWPLSTLNNVCFCQVAIHLDLRGENFVAAPHADSGAAAIAGALRALMEGKAKAAIAAGVGEDVSPFSLARGKLSGMLGDDSAFPGECGAALVLEPLALAEARGAKPIAAVAGLGFSCERSGSGHFPTESALSYAIRNSLQDAGLAPDDIDIVITGMSGDLGLSLIAESAARVFGASMQAIFSSGRILGEILAAEPVMNSIIAAMILESAHIPSALAVDSRKPDGDLRRILIAAAGCEGGAAALILSREIQ